MNAYANDECDTMLNTYAQMHTYLPPGTKSEWSLIPLVPLVCDSAYSCWLELRNLGGKGEDLERFLLRCEIKIEIEWEDIRGRRKGSRIYKIYARTSYFTSYMWHTCTHEIHKS